MSKIMREKDWHKQKREKETTFSIGGVVSKQEAFQVKFSNRDGLTEKKEKEIINQFDN